MTPGWIIVLERVRTANADDASAAYAQLATVRSDATPANRTVVVRGRLGGALVLTADARSAKAAEIAARPWGELCWWFAGTREQLRLHGRLALVADSDDPVLRGERLRTWHARSDASRQTFAWPTPGLPRADDAAFALPAPAEPPPHYALLMLTVTAAEHLDLRPHPHQRTRWRAETGWTEEAVNP